MEGNSNTSPLSCKACGSAGILSTAKSGSDYFRCPNQGCSSKFIAWASDKSDQVKGPPLTEKEIHAALEHPYKLDTYDITDLELFYSLIDQGELEYVVGSPEKHDLGGIKIPVCLFSHRNNKLYREVLHTPKHILPFGVNRFQPKKKGEDRTEGEQEDGKEGQISAVMSIEGAAMISWAAKLDKLSKSHDLKILAKYGPSIYKELKKGKFILDDLPKYKLVKAGSQKGDNENECYPDTIGVKIASYQKKGEDLKFITRFFTDPDSRMKEPSLADIETQFPKRCSVKQALTRDFMWIQSGSVSRPFSCSEMLFLHTALASEDKTSKRSRLDYEEGDIPAVAEPSSKLQKTEDDVPLTQAEMPDVPIDN